ncbi:hypothetical protein F2Q70_00016870 [Brassica cretica]|uniref:Uncharacterized protein n=1 Tax=Brassica cretica TaxID=69181 RepID=A0A8S9KMY6_BRACR|nr:hypothetical protein F2Q70_00016870 [Brassica cretica]KAF2596234.1 hypothetical protein F2Q68_00009838 [Brassica cretica]
MTSDQSKVEENKIGTQERVIMISLARISTMMACDYSIDEDMALRWWLVAHAGTYQW